MTRKQKRYEAQEQTSISEPLPIIFQVSQQTINPEDVLSCMATKELKDMATKILSLPCEDDKLLQALTLFRDYVMKVEESGDVYEGFPDTIKDYEQILSKIDSKLELGLESDINSKHTLIRMSILHAFLGCLLKDTCFEDGLLDLIGYWLNSLEDKSA